MPLIIKQIYEFSFLNNNDKYYLYMNIEILGSVRLELSEGRDINKTSDSHYNYFFKIYFYSQSCVYDDCRELHELG